MTRQRGARLPVACSAWAVFAAAIAFALLPRPALADTSFDPSGERMAITDRSTADDIQPRVWLMTVGGFLFTRRPDLNQNGWLYTGIGGLDVGLDAVSWKDGTTQRQRVFYVKNGDLYTLPFDNDVAGTPLKFGFTVLGYTIQSTDVAAVLFPVSGSQGIAAAVGGTLNGQSGYICIVESINGGSNWSGACSADRPLPPSNHDIVGVLANGSSTPEFYFENTFASLSRARRTGPSSWIAHEEIATPTLVSTSLVATPSQTPFTGKITLAYLGSDNRVHTVRINPADFPASTDWFTQPALPSGVTPYTGRTTLGGIAFHGTFFGTYDREKIYVIGQNFGLYEIATDSSGNWNASWSGPFFSPSGYIASVGAVTTTTGDGLRQPRVFGAVGYPTYTLHEFNGITTRFRDYIKFQYPSVAVGNSGVTIAETSAAADTSLAIMTGTDRNWSTPTSPWLIRLRSSTDGGNTYDTSDSQIIPFGGTSWFLTDSTALIGGGKLHHLINDVQFANGCHHTIGQFDNATDTKISYRRGTSAADIASLTMPGTNAYKVDEAANDGLDHPWMAYTPDGAVHVVYISNDPANLCGGNHKVCYWKLPSSGSAQRTIVNPLTKAPRAVRGANNEVYAFGDVVVDDWTKICTLKNAFTTGGVQEADCTMLGTCTSGTNCLNGKLNPAPSGSSSRVFVGPAISQYPTSEMECQPQPTGEKYKCFKPYAERSVAADPTTNYKVYVAYVAAASATPGIYFTHSTGGADWGVFTGPVLIAQNSTNVFNYDPQVTVDSEGTIIVSYNAFATAPGDTSGNATVYVKMSTDGGDNFTGPYVMSTWNTTSISYHCGRGEYFVGDYRDSAAYGNRAYLSVQASDVPSSYYYANVWVSRWNLTN